MKNKQTRNSRDGYNSKKTVTSEYGDVEFEPVVVKKNQTNVTGIEEHIYMRRVSVHGTFFSDLQIIF